MTMSENFTIPPVSPDPEAKGYLYVKGIGKVAKFETPTLRELGQQDRAPTPQFAEAKPTAQRIETTPQNTEILPDALAIIAMITPLIPAMRQAEHDASLLTQADFELGA